MYTPCYNLHRAADGIWKASSHVPHPESPGAMESTVCTQAGVPLRATLCPSDLPYHYENAGQALAIMCGQMGDRGGGGGGGGQSNVIQPSMLDTE